MDKSHIEEPLTSSPYKVITIARKLLSKYDLRGPRYTSYPTADQFKDVESNQAALTSMKHHLSEMQVHKPVSLYIHIPFCRSLCYYCACNKIITKQSSLADEYIDYLEKEWSLYQNIFKHDIKTHSIHLGGGSPTFLTNEQLSRLSKIYKSSISIYKHNVENSIEIDPRTVDGNRLEYIRSLGFNRISFGIQDLDPKVQKAVNREQPFEQIHELMNVAKSLNFNSINVDLIYGLPYQTKTTFLQTLDKIITLEPDRIALYGYANLPKLFKAQKSIESKELPNPASKLDMLSMAIKSFYQSGYEYIGMDHFALPDDELSVAKRQGRLFRNFQGYSLQNDDIIGLGVSSISQHSQFYYQNTKTIDDYYDSINKKEIPIRKIYSMSYDDTLRKSIIMALMCQGFINKKDFESTYNINFDQYFETELKDLVKFEQDKLLGIYKNEIIIFELGWYFIRPIAMVFDRFLRKNKNQGQFSKVI